MPGLTEEWIGGEPSNDDYVGFTLASGGVVCDVCQCLVRKLPASARTHREWHERIGG